MSFLTFLIPAIEYYETLRKKQIKLKVSSTTSSNVTFVSYTPFLVRVQEMLNLAKKSLVNFILTWFFVETGKKEFPWASFFLIFLIFVLVIKLA